MQQCKGSESDYIKVQDNQGNIRYISTKTTKNGLNPVYDEDMKPYSTIRLDFAMRFGKFKAV